MNKKITRSIMVLLAVVAGFSATTADSSDQLVGGPCNYEGPTGTCLITKVEEGSPTLFAFTGKVDGRNVQLRKNETNGPFKPSDKIPCTIQFITKGTCTPCGFDLGGTWGSCGREAWEVFRKR